MNTITITTALLMVAGIATSASAEKSHKMRKHGVNTERGMTTGTGRSYTGGNAAMQGNNGNSGQGSNSLGHIQGGNIGGGK